MPPVPTDPEDAVSVEPMVLRAAPARRAVGLVVQAALALILLWIALAHPPAEPVWRIVLLVLGAGALWLALRAWRGGAQGIVLDASGLSQEDGTPIAPLDNVAAVDRAVFAMKPSNGFVVRLHEPMGRAWVPGLWWRIGRRVGVGGITGGAETKLVADTLSLMAERSNATR